MGIHLLNVKNKNTKRRCEIYLTVTIKIKERSHWHHSGVFIFNFEQTSHFIIVKAEHTQSASTQFNKIEKEWVRDEDRPK